MMTATSSASTTSFTMPVDDTAVRRKQPGRQPDHEHTNLSDATRQNPSSPLKKPPGEGTGPTMHADFRGNLVGRVPSRGERDVFEQAASDGIDAVLETTVQDLRLQRTGSRDSSYALFIDTRLRLVRPAGGAIL